MAWLTRMKSLWDQGEKCPYPILRHSPVAKYSITTFATSA